MSYGKQLYKSETKAFSAENVYDETEKRLQNEINADVNILKQHDGVVTGKQTFSGSIATINDVEYEMPLKSCVVDIEPVQDLHGYDHPWPAGGGKNLLPMTVAGIKAENTTGTWSDNVYTINSATIIILLDDDGNITGFRANGTFSAATTFMVSNNDTFEVGQSLIINGCPNGGSTESFWQAFQPVNENTQPITSFLDTGTAATFTIPATTVTTRTTIRFASGYNAQNLLFNPMVRLSSISDATFAPYSNICPISGWTGANVTRAGKNLAKYISPNGYYDRQSGEFITDNYNGRNKPIKLTEGQIITASTRTGNFRSVSCAFFSDANATNFLSRTSTVEYTPSASFTAPANCFAIVAANISTDIKMDEQRYQDNIQIEFGPASSFEPYTDTSLSVIFPSSTGTVYGGTLDVTNGVLTVDRKTKTYVGAENEDFSLSAVVNGYGRFYNNKISDASKLVEISDVIANEFETTDYRVDKSSYDNPYKNTIVTSTSSAAGRFGVLLNGVTSLEDFKAWLSVNNLQIVYKLAQPLIIQLDPITITTLLGQNNIWADTGDISVSYGGLISVIDRSIDTLTDRLDNLKADQIKAKGLGEIEAEPGDIVTVTDAAEFPVKDLKVGIKPVQDLHGYENPWPAGGGKNKFEVVEKNDSNWAQIAGTEFMNSMTISEDAINTIAKGNGQSVIYRLFPYTPGIWSFNFKNNQNYNKRCLIKCFDSNGNNISSEVMISGFTYLSYYSGLYADNNNGWTFEVPSSVSYFYIGLGYKDDVAGTAVVISEIQLESGSSITTFAPYSNICPISGWAGCNVMRTGKNLIPENGPISVSGSQNIKYCNVKGGESYMISMLLSRISGVTIYNSTINAYGLFEYDQNNNLIYAKFDHAKSLPSGSVDVPYSNTFTTDPKTVKIGINVGNNNGDNNNVNTIKDKIQVEVGSTATSFESYIAPEIFPITFPSEVGMVYGGTLDVTSGVLTVDKYYKVIDGTEEVTINSDRFIVTVANQPYVAPIDEGINVICNYYKSYSNSGLYNVRNNSDTTGCAIQSRQLQIVDNVNFSGASVDTFKTHLATLYAAGTPIVAVWKLATPQTYQLTSAEVTTILGQNNIWADCGPIESLTYIGTETSNIQDEIDEFENKIGNIAKSIALAQEGVIAKRNYSIGELVFIGNDLYEMTANVPYGNSLVNGTNCKKTTVAEKFNSIEGLPSVTASDQGKILMVNSNGQWIVTSIPNT